MGLRKKVIAIITASISMIMLFCCATTVDAARTDMVDVSNYNGDMTVANFQDMYNNYGVKAVVTKISEGTSFKDSTAANNIATAQQAGLYINGYHYAHYNSVSTAVSEADYAAQTAQSDGLPSGSVLVADVESTEQSTLSTSQNDADNQAFMNEVAKYGYRSAIYTMGSWVGTVMTVDNGWIASYPYDPTSANWYTVDHAWQWSSSYQFSGSYGNFDVSQLNDSFFASYQSPSSTSSTTTTTTDNSSSTTDNNSGSDATTNSGSSTNNNVITVNNQNGSYIPLVAISSDGSVSTIGNRALSNNSSWQTDQTKVINGTTYYRVATNEWVADTYLAGNQANTSSSSTNSSVIEVRNSDSSYVQLVALQSDGTMKDVLNRALANNTSWQTDQTKVVGGVTYYRVATNEWVAANYVL